LIFCSTKYRLQWLQSHLSDLGANASSLQAGAEPRRRDRIMMKFATGQINVLLTTDVLTRGIDVPELDLVVNYEPADNALMYVHRIGRTARFGKKGKAVTFLTTSPEDASRASGIIGVLEQSHQPVSKELRELAASSDAPEPLWHKRGGGYIEEDKWEEEIKKWQLP